MPNRRQAITWTNAHKRWGGGGVVVDTNGAYFDVLLIMSIIRVGEEVENEENSTEEMVEHPAITVTTYGSDGTTNGMAGTHPGNKDGVDNKGFAGDDVSAYQTTGEKTEQDE